jgi:hypothetical protein
MKIVHVGKLDSTGFCNESLEYGVAGATFTLGIWMGQSILFQSLEKESVVVIVVEGSSQFLH